MKNAVILLEALLEGQELEIQLSPKLRSNVAIVETEDSQYQLCHIMHKIDTKKPDEPPEKMYMRLDMSVNQLLTYANTLSQDELFKLSMGTALLKLHHERAEAREKVMEKSRAL